MSADQKPAAAEPAASSTSYIVLKLIPDQEAWTVVNMAASFKSGEAAIRSVVAKLAGSDQAGTFVAVPARSWKPVKVSAKVETTLVIEDVKA